MQLTGETKVLPDRVVKGRIGARHVKHARQRRKQVRVDLAEGMSDA